VLAILSFPLKLKCVGFGDGVLNRASETNMAALSAIVLEGMLRTKEAGSGGGGLGLDMKVEYPGGLRGYILECKLGGGR